jgi:hypothetical protein
MSIVNILSQFWKEALPIETTLFGIIIDLKPAPLNA